MHFFVKESMLERERVYVYVSLCMYKYCTDYLRVFCVYFMCARAIVKVVKALEGIEALHFRWKRMS